MIEFVGGILFVVLLYSPVIALLLWPISLLADWCVEFVTSGRSTSNMGQRYSDFYSEIPEGVVVIGFFVAIILGTILGLFGFLDLVGATCSEHPDGGHVIRITMGIYRAGTHLAGPLVVVGGLIGGLFLARSLCTASFKIGKIKDSLQRHMEDKEAHR